MTFLKNKILTITFLSLLTASTQTYDVLFEGKGAYFLATDQIFKQIYNNGCWEFGLEATAQIIDHIYGFASFDLFNKSGDTTEFYTPSKFHSTNFGIGLKYFMPFDKGDFYIGIGATPIFLRTLDYSGYIQHKTDRWGFGGITKLGVILDLNKNFFMNLYIDYQFAHIQFNKPIGNINNTTTAILDGAIFGAGFGYRFN